MSNFVPNPDHLRKVLLHCIILQKTFAKSHCILGRVRLKLTILQFYFQQVFMMKHILRKRQALSLFSL